MTYSYSTDGEMFRGQFDTEEDAKKEGFRKNEEFDSIEIAKNVEETAHYFVDIENLFDNMQCQAYDECGEGADDWLISLGKDEKKCDELKKIIGDWIEENEPVNFLRVTNVKKVYR